MLIALPADGTGFDLEYQVRASVTLRKHTSREPGPRLREDMARCIAALCHPATTWLTGNTLRVDGGENIVG